MEYSTFKLTWLPLIELVVIPLFCDIIACLYFSVNEIRSLKDFAYCIFFNSLYVCMANTILV